MFGIGYCHLTQCNNRRVWIYNWMYWIFSQLQTTFHRSPMSTVILICIGLQRRTCLCFGTYDLQGDNHFTTTSVGASFSWRIPDWNEPATSNLSFLLSIGFCARQTGLQLQNWQFKIDSLYTIGTDHTENTASKISSVAISYSLTIAGLLMWGALSDHRMGLWFTRIIQSQSRSEVLQD